MPVWPLLLPQKPLARGFTLTPEPNVVEFESEVGVEHSRRRSTARREGIQCQFLFDGEERKIFTSFFRNDLIDGVLPYDWNHPVEEVLAKFKIRSHSFTNPGGDNWLYSFQIRRIG